MGAGIGIAALAYSRRRRSRWERAKDQASHLVDRAQKEYEPWMGVAAGTAAAGTALAAYLRRRKETGWERAVKRAGGIASRVGTHATNRWANLAAIAAIGLYADRARRRTIRGIDASTAGRINALAETGSNFLRRVRNVSEQTGKFYPQLRRAMAS
jgi:hypothetical protein